MEQIDIYIGQVRQYGKTDEQIRQTLVAAGWNLEQVNKALAKPSTPSPATTAAPSKPSPPSAQPTNLNSPPANSQTPANSKPLVRTDKINTAPLQSIVTKLKSRPLLAVAGLIALLVIIAAGSAYVVYGHKTSYQTVIQDFISAMQRKDKATVYSLESPAAKALFQKNNGTSNFYDACQQSGDLCTPFFASSYFARATKTYKDYTASNGTKGKEVIYIVKQSINRAQAGGQGCSSNSTSTLTIAVVPKGRSWLVDSSNQNFSASSSACLYPDSST